jgi:IMP dehydrogenase
MAILHRFCTEDEQAETFNKVESPWRVGAAIGLDQKDRFWKLYEAGCRIFCLDVAYANTPFATGFVKWMRRRSNDIYIIAGSVATLDGAKLLYKAGADSIRLGIGSGGTCQTRVKTSIGVPQFSAVQECKPSWRYKYDLISDGGIRTAGDAALALAAGANFVMCGSIFSGTDEAPGEVFQDEEGNSFKLMRGMASDSAQRDFFGSDAVEKSNWKTAEGVEVRVPCKGPVANIVQDLMGGIRSSMTYTGAYDLKDFREKAKFIRITNAGNIEGKPHLGL